MEQLQEENTNFGILTKHYARMFTQTFHMYAL